MLLGTFHFEGSPTDDHSVPGFDGGSARGRTEIQAVIDRLARWAPQQIAVELPAADSVTTAAAFGRYLAANGATDARGEVEQVAFRLARRLGHATVYPIDYQIPIGNDSIGALIARRPDLQRRAESLGRSLAADLAASDRAEAGKALLARLRAVNSDSALHAGNSGSMFYYLGVGEGSNRGGPQLLARWYERNFQMAHNLTRVVRPGA